MSEGVLHKMKTHLDDEVIYHLELSDLILMNELLGQELKLTWNGQIFCSSCGKITKRSFGDGFCYPCFISAPEAAECIIRPELCRAHLGEGRDPEWEIRNHNVPHVVYLAASDIVKVGITRGEQVPTRWIDQGASAAIRLAETPNRYEAGMIEVALKSFFSDKTNWQRMLKNEVDENIDLVEEKWNLHDQLPSDLTIYFSENDEVTEITYPVLQFPDKVKSLTFDKDPVIQSKLMGVKGQYLIFSGGLVLNVRKHTGYRVGLEF